MKFGKCLWKMCRTICWFFFPYIGSVWGKVVSFLCLLQINAKYKSLGATVQIKELGCVHVCVKQERNAQYFPWFWEQMLMWVMAIVSKAIFDILVSIILCKWAKKCTQECDHSAWSHPQVLTALSELSQERWCLIVKFMCSVEFSEWISSPYLSAVY